MTAHTSPLRVLFRVAAGPRTGFGHLVRANSLARALGVRPVFSIRGPRSARETARRLGGRTLVAESAADTLERQVPDVLVIDDRVAAATRSWRRAARRRGVPIVSVHDLALGAGDADLVVDGSLGAERCWGKLGGRAGFPVVPSRAVLLGPRFAILNPRCVERRQGSGVAHQGAHVVIALGGGPRRRAAVRLASMILRRIPAARVSVAGGFVSGGGRAAAGIRWLSPSSLGAALASATVAVVGGGVTLYEAAALGVPTVAVAVVASQRPTVEAFAARGAAVDGGLLAPGAGQGRTLEALSARAARLLHDDVARRRLGRMAARLVDGNGAARVARGVRGLVSRRAQKAALR
jgi:spore coat polysaccharide biosynthesis predicted glycosyltransferase SpsG